jgi:hypothetical protein
MGSKKPMTRKPGKKLGHKKEEKGKPTEGTPAK